MTKIESVSAQKTGTPSERPVSHSFDYNGTTLTLNDTGVVVSGGQYVHLTSLQRSLLQALIATPGTLKSKEELMRVLYKKLSGHGIPEMKIIDVVVCTLRRALRPSGFDVIIHTIWGRGYVLDERPPPAAIRGSRAKTGISVSTYDNKYWLEDLPRPGQRWVYHRKATAVHLVEEGALSLADLMSRYPDLTEPEYAHWKDVVTRNGDQGLRVTYCQHYAALAA